MHTISIARHFENLISSPLIVLIMSFSVVRTLGEWLKLIGWLINLYHLNFFSRLIFLHLFLAEWLVNGLRLSRVALCQREAEQC